MTNVPRMSFLGANLAAQSRLRAAYARMEKANQQVSTGKAYFRPSENQSASARAAVLQDQLDQVSSFGRAIDDSRSRLSLADTKMQQAMDLYHRITELATQAASSINSADSRKAIREEVLQLHGELESIANTQHLGAPIFGGFGAGNAVSFDTTSSSWVFAGSPSDRLQRRIGPNEVVDTSITAGELFSNGTTDIFTVLDGLATALNNNDTPNIQASLDQVTSLRSTLSSGQARMGAVVNRVEQASDRNASIKVTLTAELSQVQDVDIGDAMTDQSRLTMAYQAALGVTAKANSQTLLDWLR
ncbi:MAG: flagellar hook-associated protein 3 FlgL [Ilumatobacteraceae bacterium]